MTNLVRWDPFSRALSLRDTLDRWFDERWVRSFEDWPFRGEAVQTLALDVTETDENLIVEASMPGFDLADDVEITVAGQTLTIKGEKKHEDETEEPGKYYYRERRYGAFQRSMTLPTEVKAEAAEAVLEKGELKLTLPKVEGAKAKRIEIIRK